MQNNLERRKRERKEQRDLLQSFFKKEKKITSKRERVNLSINL